MATLKAVQKGTATIAAGSATGTATISAVTTANTFISITYRSAAGADNVSYESVVISALTSTQITFARQASTGAPLINIEWCATEFSSGVTVQRGSTLTTAVTTNQSISSVTTTKSWVIANWLGGVAETFVIGGQSCTSAAITTATNLALVCDGWYGDLPDLAPTVYWQVVSYDNCTTALYTHSKTGSGDSTQTITSVTTTKALIFDTFSWNEDPMHDSDAVKMYLTNATTVTFNSYGWQAGTQTHKLYTINFTDSVAVQRADTAIASGNTVETPTITSVTTANSIVHITGTVFNTLATVNYTTDGRIDYNAFSASISAATTVTLTRATSGYAGICPWEVIDFTGILVAGTKRSYIIWIMQ